MAVRDRPVDSVTVGRGRLDGAPAVVALAPVPDTRWVVTVSLPLRVALAPVARMRNVAVAGAAALVALLVLTGVVAARSVTTPVRQLAVAARAFGRSGTVAPLPEPGADEIGSLVRSFERMTQDLQRSQDEIRRLHEAELQRTQQLASVGELASGVAHEIRNPLTGVLGALDLALKRIPAGDPSRPLLEESEKQLRRIEGTTTQLLRYARPPELREVSVDANELVERAGRVVGPQAAAAGVRIDVRPVARPLPVRADPEQVVQVLVNLGLNAIQAMNGDGVVTVTVAASEGAVRIAVRDTGPGVPPDLKPEIFRPFFTTKHQGTGLGLSISRQIIERHGGRMWLDDETPGATFVIELPALPEEKNS